MTRVETDTPHDTRMQFAMLCAEVLVHTGVATGYASAAVQLRLFWGTRGMSQPRVWNWCMDVMFAERWRTLAEGWEEARCSSACHLHKAFFLPIGPY